MSWFARFCREKFPEQKRQHFHDFVFPFQWFCISNVFKLNFCWRVVTALLRLASQSTLFRSGFWLWRIYTNVYKQIQMLIQIQMIQMIMEDIQMLEYAFLDIEFTMFIACIDTHTFQEFVSMCIITLKLFSWSFCSRCKDSRERSRPARKRLSTLVNEWSFADSLISDNRPILGHLNHYLWSPEMSWLFKRILSYFHQSSGNLIFLSKFWELLIFGKFEELSCSWISRGMILNFLLRKKGVAKDL